MKILKLRLAAAILAVFALTTSAAMASINSVYQFDNVNVAIPENDATGVTNTQSIAGTGGTVITDVDVDLHINHTWQGDLIVNLTHDSTTVPLLFRAGDSDRVVGGAGFSADNFGADADRFILDDEAAAAYDSTIGWGSVADPGIAAVGGSWIPYGEFPGGPLGGLTAFDGMSDSGNWTLFVSDNAGGDIGTLVSWSLHITTEMTTAAIPEPSSWIIFSIIFSMTGSVFVRRRKKPTVTPIV